MIELGTRSNNPPVMENDIEISLNKLDQKKPLLRKYKKYKVTLINSLFYEIRTLELINSYSEIK